MKLKLVALAAASLALTACGNLNQPKSYWCPPENTAEVLSLSANALFKFNNGTEAGLLPKSKEELKELAAKLKQENVTVEKIDVIGHADQIGSDSYNQKLGLKRAETVKGYLAKQGVEAPISVSSEGKQHKITDCQGTKVTDSLKECLQPDRRAEVKVEAKLAPKAEAPVEAEAKPEAEAAPAANP